MQQNKNILIINDMPGYGKVALAAMLPILSHMGHNIYNLPTALVSNTLDYGKFTILDTTDYMKKSIAVWKELASPLTASPRAFWPRRSRWTLSAPSSRARGRRTCW